MQHLERSLGGPPFVRHCSEFRDFFLVHCVDRVFLVAVVVVVGIIERGVGVEAAGSCGEEPRSRGLGDAATEDVVR